MADQPKAEFTAPKKETLPAKTEPLTPQEQAKQGYQMLDDSETTAIAVGLQLAGYKNVAVGRGVQVVSILPESHANGILKTGDVITHVNGAVVTSPQAYYAAVKGKTGTLELKLYNPSNDPPITIQLK